MFLTRSEDIPRTGKPWRVVEAPNPDTTPCQIRRFRYTETCQFGIITANLDPDMDLLKGEAMEWLDGDEDDVKREVVLENTRSLPNLPALARFLNENPDMESLYCFTTAGFRAFIDNELPAIYGVASVTEGLLRGVDTTGLEPACVIWEEECYSLKDLGWLRLEHPDFGIRYVKAENWEVWCGGWDVNRIMSGVSGYDVWRISTAGWKWLAENGEFSKRGDSHISPSEALARYAEHTSASDEIRDLHRLLNHNEDQ